MTTINKTTPLSSKLASTDFSTTEYKLVNNYATAVSNRDTEAIKKAVKAAQVFYKANTLENTKEVLKERATELKEFIMTKKENEAKLTPMQKAEKTIKEIKAKGAKATAYDLQRLANAQLKQEQKSLRYVHGQLKRAYESGKSDFEKTILELSGSKFPTFASFKNTYKSKYVSMWGGMATLRALNPKFKLAVKVERQNKAEAKK